MGYRVSASAWSGMFALPSEVVDKYVKLSSAGAVKVLLVIFRNGGSVDEEEIARKLNMKPDDVEDALEYWTECGILQKDGEEPKVSKVQYEEEICKKAEVKEKRSATQLKPLTAPIKKPTPKEIDSIGKQEDVQMLLREAEATLGKTFTSSDTSTLIWLYSWAGIPADVLLMIIAYCKYVGKTGMNYIQSTAISWVNDGIDTVEKAEEYIEKRYGQDEFERRIRRVFGLWGRAFTESEKKKLEEWREYVFSDEMYKEAYDRTVEATGKVSFAYINSILVTWNQKGIRNLEAAQEESAQRKQEKENAEQSYDIDEIERSIMERNQKMSMEA